MAKVIVAGTTANIVSTLSLEDIKKAERYAPKSLKLFDEDGKNVVFAVGTASEGSISKYGASFSVKTFDGAGKATAAITIPAGTIDAKKFVSENFGYTLMSIDKVEAQVGAALEIVDDDLATVEGNITIA